MATQNKGNYKCILIITVIFILAAEVFADNNSAAKILSESYNAPVDLKAEQTEEMIGLLNQARQGCSDTYLDFRIRYRIGVLYFKISDYEKAIGKFESISDEPNCPEMINLASINMSAQTYRMLEDESKARQAFDKLTQQAQDMNDSPMAMKLCTSAFFAKAEIYQGQKDYSSAIKEYLKLIQLIQDSAAKDYFSYMPQALDKISQLYLLQNDMDNYFAASQKIVQDYPTYYRVDVIKFEIYAIKKLREKVSGTTFAKGSYQGPVMLNDLIYTSKDAGLAQGSIEYLQSLCDKAQNFDSKILLSYHLGWLMDAAGQKQKAMEVFKNIASVKTESKKSNAKSITDNIIEYSKLQMAIICGETQDYKLAFDAVTSITNSQQNEHITELSKSINQSLETLQREVPKDANYQ